MDLTIKKRQHHATSQTEIPAISLDVNNPTSAWWLSHTLEI
jgi:hypothetical protein